MNTNTKPMDKNTNTMDKNTNTMTKKEQLALIEYANHFHSSKVIKLMFKQEISNGPETIFAKNIATYNYYPICDILQTYIQVEGQNADSVNCVTEFLSLLELNNDGSTTTSLKLINMNLTIVLKQSHNDKTLKDVFGFIFTNFQ